MFQILNDRNISFVLVGGIAIFTYIEGRNTDDLDLVLSVESLKDLPEVIVSSQDREFARGMFGDLQVDFPLTSNPLFEKVQRYYSTTHRFLEMQLRRATIEGLLLLKMFALPSLYRQGNLSRVGLYENDIYTLYGLGRPDMTPLFSELAPFVTERQLSDIKIIVGEFQLRIARLDRAKSAPG